MKQRGLFFALILILSLLLLPAAPAAAQTGGRCEIDLTDLMAGLAGAQQQADADEVVEAVLTLEKIRAELDALIKACESVSLPLPQGFTSSDKRFKFSYPDGWVIDDAEPDIFYIANNLKALEVAATGDLERLAPGDRIIAFMLPPVEDLQAEGLDFDAVVELLSQNSLNDPTITLTGPEAGRIQRFETREFTLSSDAVAGFFTVVNFGRGAILITAGLAPAGEAESLEPVYRSVLKSVRYGSTHSLLPPGRPLAEIRYVDAVLLPDLIEELKPLDARSAVLAPDGSAVAWLNRGEDSQEICVYSFAGAAVACTALPEGFNSRPPLLLWSPDSRYIAFGEEFFRTFREPDIWLLDVAEQRITNRTNDGIDRSLFGLTPPDQDVEGSLWIDHTFAWGPAGDLYFIRQELTEPSNRDSATSGLYRLAPEGGEAELVRDLTGEMQQFSIYNLSEEYHLSGAMAVAPNGQTIAFLVRENSPTAPNNGIWTLDLSGETAPQHLVTVKALAQGLPPYALEREYGVIPHGLGWSDNSQALFVLAGMLPVYESPPARIVSRIDPVSGDLTPLVDLSRLETEEDLYAVDPTTGYEGLYSLVRTVVMSPDRTTPLVFNVEQVNSRRAGLRALDPDQSSDEPALLYEIGEYQVIPAEIATTAADGKLLINGYLFMPE